MMGRVDDGNQGMMERKRLAPNGSDTVASKRDGVRLERDGVEGGVLSAELKPESLAEVMSVSMRPEIEPHRRKRLPPPQLNPSATLPTAAGGNGVARMANELRLFSFHVTLHATLHATLHVTSFRTSRCR